MTPELPQFLDKQARPPSERVPPAKAKHRRWLWLSVFFVLGLGIYFLWPEIKHVESNAPTAAKGPPPILVVTAKARKGDIGVYFTGLGAVTPINTVTVKSRVDGQLMSVRYKEGDLVTKGDPLLEIDPRPFEVQLTQAQGQLIKDQAALANARVDLVRYQTLVAQNATPEQMLATQEATVAQDEGIVKSDQGQIDSANLSILYCHVTAPVSGRIGLRLVDPGNIVHASDTNGLLVITQIQPISVIFTISEDQLPVVIKNMSGGKPLTVEAYNREMNSKIAAGALTTLDNQIDPTTGTLKLRATFANTDNALFPNQFVNARLLVQEKTGVTLAPTAAIQRNTQSTYVYLVKPDSTVTVRTITLGTSEGDDSEITSGLVPGDVIVMTGVDKLQEGTKVSPQDSSTPPATAKKATGG
jgi:multidrug efflux system membrane fusion protein